MYLRHSLDDDIERGVPGHKRGKENLFMDSFLRVDDADCGWEDKQMVYLFDSRDVLVIDLYTSRVA